MYLCNTRHSTTPIPPEADRNPSQRKGEVLLPLYGLYINYQGRPDWTVKFIVCSAALLAASFLLTTFVDSPIQKVLRKR